MAQVIVTLKIMPASVEISLDNIEEQTSQLIKEFGGEVGKTEKIPIAFGLKALNIIFVMDEDIGSTEDLEKKISELKGVNSVEVADVRRAIG